MRELKVNDDRLLGSIEPSNHHEVMSDREEIRIRENGQNNDLKHAYEVYS